MFLVYFKNLHQKFTEFVCTFNKGVLTEKKIGTTEFIISDGKFDVW